MVPGRRRHPVPPPGAIEYSPLTRVLSAVMGTVAPSTVWARAKSSYLRSPVGGVAKATAMERTVVKTTTAAAIEVLRMVVPPNYEMQCCDLPSGVLCGRGWGMVVGGVGEPFGRGM